MKFMKLGSKPDTFYTAETVSRSVSSEVSCDLIIQVEGCRYLLHKFPVLSKCLRLQKLCADPPDSSQSQLQIIKLPDFPGGIESFELCAKFCYGITITLSAYNIVAARCAAEYLQMTEVAEKGNLIYKMEVFFNSCILHGWKDSITTLQSTKSFPQWSEDLAITSRCIEAIASRVLTHPDPSKVALSQYYSNSRKGKDKDKDRDRDDEIHDGLCNGGVESSSQHQHMMMRRNKPNKLGWWGEDIAELSIDHYWRAMIAIKSGGKVPSTLIGEALQIYAARWFPSKDDDDHIDPIEDRTSKHRFLLESIVSLLPADKGAVPTSFLLKLLKAVNQLNIASSSFKTELAKRVGIQLEDATVKDLLIPSVLSYENNNNNNNNNVDGTKFDVDIVLVILEQFMRWWQGRRSPPTSPPRPVLVKGRLFERRRRSRSAESIDMEFQESSRRSSSSASHSSKLRVAKLVDGYLQEIAGDPNLPLSKMVAVAEAIPDYARADHDHLYKAIDIYLKAHAELSKSERKKLCRALNCKKLSVEACMHAAQNELLPLRVVVQVLFYEHVRAAMAGGNGIGGTDLPHNIKALLASQEDDSSRPPGTILSARTAAPDPEDQWSVSGIKSPKPKISTLKMKLAEDEMDESNDHMNTATFLKGSRLKSLCSLPSRPKRMFSKLLSMNRGASSEKS
ncbi:hypothetical protein Dimus_015145 [Dionaea muscipula]